MFYNASVNPYISDMKMCGDCKDFLSVFEFSYKVRERGLLQSYCMRVLRRD